MNENIIHNFCESKLSNNEPPEILNSYTSLFITIIPIIFGFPKNNIFFNIACMFIFNGFASFYYHYTLSWSGKQSDEISMIMATYFGINGLLKIYFINNEPKLNFYSLFNNIYSILFIIINTNVSNDKFFPFLFTIHVLFTIFLIYKISKKYDYYKDLVLYKKNLAISACGAACWIISELYCNKYTKFGHVIWHLLFPLGFYKLILNFDKLLYNLLIKNI